LLESQYSQFKSELNNDSKPKGTAFLTDDRKDLLAIGADSSSAVNQQKQKPVTTAPALSNKKKMLNPE
jgi:hypothetical protein